MTNPTSFESELGRSIRSRFGQNTKVTRFADESEENFVFIVRGSDCPVDGVTSYGTVGLYKTPQRTALGSVNVEIVTACATETLYVDNLIASCVFDSETNNSNVSYGSYIKNVLDQYRVSQTLRHVAFVSPFLWNDLNKIVVEGMSVYCLMMIAISDAEVIYLESHGIDALERLFSEKQIDLFDINRSSIL